jgi:hypothetical protein
VFSALAGFGIYHLILMRPTQGAAGPEIPARKSPVLPEINAAAAMGDHGGCSVNLAP